MQNIGQGHQQEGMHVLPLVQELAMPVVSLKPNTSGTSNGKSVQICAKELYKLLPVTDQLLIDCLLAGMAFKEMAVVMKRGHRTLKARASRLCYQLGIDHSIAGKGSKLISLFLDVLMLEQQPLPKSFHFTPREMDIIRRMAEGKTYIVIGQELGIVPNTVKNIVAGRATPATDNIFDKTGCSKRSELVVWYEAHRLALNEPLREPTIITVSYSRCGQRLKRTLLAYMYGARA